VTVDLELLIRAPRVVSGERGKILEALSNFGTHGLGAPRQSLIQYSQTEEYPSNHG